LERRQRQAELIRRWKPWERSTGPKTEEGKKASAQRGFKGGLRQQARLAAAALKAQREALDAMERGEEL
jgi:hypothetical protein